LRTTVSVRYKDRPTRVPGMRVRRRILTMLIFKWKVFIFFYFIFFLMTGISYCAPLIYRQQQVKAMRQQQAQEEYQQEYQQQQGAQGQGQQAAVQQTYDQKIDQRNQSIAQAILDAHNQSVSNVNSQASNNAAGSQVQQQAVSPGVDRQMPPSSSDTKDVVDLSEVWKKLDNKSTVWTLLMDDQSKILTVSEYIERFQKEGVKINAPPMHYVQEIDQIAGSNPGMLQRPFGELVQILAIVDYDFDNGMDKDELARKVLGEAGYEVNKKRFSQQSSGN
jgi:hypothetical protein